MMISRMYVPEGVEWSIYVKCRRAHSKERIWRIVVWSRRENWRTARPRNKAAAELAALGVVVG